MSESEDKKGGKKSEEEREVDKEARHRQITPVAVGEVAKLLAWLENLFVLSPNDAAPGKVKSEPDSLPERIVMSPVYGLGGRERGIEINPHYFKPMTQKVPSREVLVEWANEYYRKARQHATAMRVTQRYCVFAYNNVKGPDAYDTHPFVIAPGARDAEASREYENKKYAGGLPAADDEDTHRDREMSELRADRRWMFEQFTEMTSGLMKMQAEMLADSREYTRQLEADRRADRIAAEEALSRSREREQQAKWAETKNTIITDVWAYAKGNFLPAVTAYLSKGKDGIRQMVGALFEGLSKEQKDAILGVWQRSGDDNVCVAKGVLDEDQVGLFIGVLTGDLEPTRISEFITSLRADQYAAAQQHLSEQQIGQLMTIARVAGDVGGGNGASA